MNLVTLIGNLTKDPELQELNSGVKVAKFTIAVSRKFKNADGERQVDFINCVAWKNNAEFISKYFNKGSKIAVNGAIQVRNYDAQDGTKKYITEVVVDNAEFSSGKVVGDKKLEELQEMADDSLPF